MELKISKFKKGKKESTEKKNSMSKHIHASKKSLFILNIKDYLLANLFIYIFFSFIILTKENKIFNFFSEINITINWIGKQQIISESSKMIKSLNYYLIKHLSTEFLNIILKDMYII